MRARIGLALSLVALGCTTTARTFEPSPDASLDDVKQPDVARDAPRDAPSPDTSSLDAPSPDAPDVTAPDVTAPDVTAPDVTAASPAMPSEPSMKLNAFVIPTIQSTVSGQPSDPR